MRPQRLNKQDQEDLKKYRKLVAEGHKEFIPMVEWFENGKRRVYPAHKAKLMKRLKRDARPYSGESPDTTPDPHPRLGEGQGRRGKRWCLGPRY